MNPLKPQKDRRVVPRWRASKTVAGSSEWTPLRPGSTADDHLQSAVFEQKREAWRQHQSATHAAELVGTALVLMRGAEAQDAAEFLLSPDVSVPPAVKGLAHRLLRNDEVDGEDDELRDETAQDPNPIARRAGHRIHNHRRRLLQDPRNAVLRVDLAREYAILGKSKRASKLMETAVALSPASRFVLRSATRLYLHQDETDRARSLLLRQPITRIDPWLLAAEISTAMVGGHTSRLVRAARELLEDGNYHPAHTTELASALATLDLFAGKDKDARKLFRRSLTAPTDNAIAQAFWAAHLVSGFEPDPQILGAPYTYEARAIDEYWTSDWDGALVHCNLWLEDEPFSTRPAILGSYLAGVLDQLEMAESICHQGLRANPGDKALLNNLAVALAHRGDAVGARKAISCIDRSSLTQEQQIVVTATEGLIHFREGDPTLGRGKYQSALSLAGDSDKRGLRVAALIYLAREEWLARTADATVAVERARDECMKGNNSTLRTLFNVMLSGLEEGSNR